LYAFRIVGTFEGEKPDDLWWRLDEVTDQLAIMRSRDDDFADFMVTRHTWGDTTFFIVVDGKESEAQALLKAISLLKTALHAAGLGTPEWLKIA
jgi:hypothetical protein